MGEQKFTNKVVGKTDSGVPVRATKELEDVIAGGGGGGVTPEGLTEILKGSENITVDLSGDEETVVVDLDQDVKDAINGKQEALEDSVEIVLDSDSPKLLLAQTVSNKINNSLQLPDQAPTEDKLVAIGTNGAQKLIDVPTNTKKYQHDITINLSNITSTMYHIIIINSSSSPITNIVNALATYVGKATSSSDYSKSCIAYGCFRLNDGGDWNIATSVTAHFYTDIQSNYYLYYIYYNGTNNKFERGLNQLYPSTQIVNDRITEL